MKEIDSYDSLIRLLSSLQEDQQESVPTGTFGRTLRTARAAAGVGFQVLTGKLRNRPEGEGVPDLEAVQKLVQRFGKLKGLAMKAGQMFSYLDASMSPDVQKLLGVLQTQSQPTSWDKVEQTVLEDLGDPGKTLVQCMARKPISVASIGQVHRATLPDGVQVAVKVRHPGIVEAFESDFGAAKIAPVFARLVVPGGGATVSGFVDEMRQRMLEECDFELEAKRQQRFRELLAEDRWVVVPEVLPGWSATRVLVTRWESGMGLEEFLQSSPSQEQRNHIGEALFDIYFGTLYRHGLFHADPHPGNYAFTPEGKVILYDFGCAREFHRDTVRSLAQLAHAVADDDEQSIRSAFVAMGGRVPDSKGAYQHVRELSRSFFSPLLQKGKRRVDSGSDALDMAQVFKNKKMLMKLQLPGKFMFLFRIRYGLYAVLARIGCECDWYEMEHALAAEAL